MGQKATAILPYPNSFFRLVFRLPIYFYRLGLGRLVSWLPFLVVTTRGRSSGQPRHVVLEYRRHGSKYYVVSGWGERPDWFKNILADPTVTLRRGNRLYAARAQIVDDPTESWRALYQFRHRSPIYGRMMALMSTADQINMKTLSEVANEFTVVRLDLVDVPPPLPSVKADHTWVSQMLAVLGLAVLVARLVRRKHN